MSTLLPKWRQISFSITAIGTVLIKDVGTDPETIRDPGFISFPRECQLSCYVCRPIIAMSPPGQLKKNWRTWEKEKHWDKHESRYEGKERHATEKGEHKPSGGRGKGK
jgi:hypothetical protein